MARAREEELNEFGRFSNQLETINSGWAEHLEDDEIEPEIKIFLEHGLEAWLKLWMPFLNSGVLFRILGGYETMFLNCCDPDADTLEFKPGFALLPTRLTAENGAKSELMGEFFETIEVLNPEIPEETIGQKVPVSWTTIKAIWKQAVELFTEPQGASRGSESKP